MGSEARCHVEIDGETFEDVKVLLETNEVILRGAVKMRVPFSDAEELTEHDGILSFRAAGRALHLHLGPSAAKWAGKIRNPKSVLDKIGLQAGQSVSVMGSIDDQFLADASAAGAKVVRGLRKSSDVVFLAVSKRADLAKLENAKAALKSSGAIWVIRPKGTAAITDGDVIAAARSAGLVDVKVVRFSATHSAEKLVIPLASR
jgi:hypothetical protein